jgi:hypothetical protein
VQFVVDFFPSIPVPSPVYFKCFFFHSGTAPRIEKKHPNKKPASVAFVILATAAWYPSNY